MRERCVSLKLLRESRRALLSRYPYRPRRCRQKVFSSGVKSTWEEASLLEEDEEEGEAGGSWGGEHRVPAGDDGSAASKVNILGVPGTEARPSDGESKDSTGHEGAVDSASEAPGEPCKGPNGRTGWDGGWVCEPESQEEREGGWVICWGTPRSQGRRDTEEDPRRGGPAEQGEGSGFRYLVSNRV